jgi:hypothetical protein
VYLIQLLLPIRDAAGRPFPEAHFGTVRRELTERFGGVTAFMRTPATGLWKDSEGTVERDEVVMVEVVTERLDRAWWRLYCARLTEQFEQDTMHVRSLTVELL